MLAVRWYLRYGLSYHDLEELPAEQGVEVDHVSLFRWVRTPLLSSSGPPGPAGIGLGGRWLVDETSVKVAGVWRYLYGALD